MHLKLSLLKKAHVSLKGGKLRGGWVFSREISFFGVPHFTESFWLFTRDYVATMPMIGKPKYPVIDPDPSWGRVFSNMNVGDVSSILGFSGAGFAVGFFGSKIKTRAHMARFNMGIGLFAGVCYAALSSSQRLLGVSENSYEVSKYGTASKSDIDYYTDRTYKANIELIDAPKN